MEIAQDLQLGHLGFKFWVGHNVADVLGESFMIPSFYPGKCHGLPPLFPALWFCSPVTVKVGRGSLSTFSKPDGKKPFFFFPSHQHIYLGVKTLLRKVFGSKVGNSLAKANHFPSGVCLGEEPRVKDRQTRPAPGAVSNPLGEEHDHGPSAQVSCIRHRLQDGVPAASPAPVSHTPPGR